MDIELHSPLRGSKVNIWRTFLAKTGLTADTDAQQTVLVWEDEQLIATGSRAENLLKYIAVDPAWQGEGLLAKVLTALRQEAFLEGYQHLFLYTKPANEYLFRSLAFYPVAKTGDVLLMEDKREGILEFLQSHPSGMSAGIPSHEMKLNPEPFEMIKSGEKTIELRLYDEKRRQVRVGDGITFTNTLTGEQLRATVANLHLYDSFDALYRSLPLLRCGYTAENVAEATAADMEAYYCVEKQHQYGVVGIELCDIQQRSDKTVGAAVMNCDPFTLGHQHLIETAAAECDLLYVFVLSEDKGRFSAADRLEMVKRGTVHLSNVTVLPTGPYLISSATFPTYFLKDREKAEQVQCLLDVEVFCKYFVPRFGITRRYVGTEPLSPTTNLYNEALLSHLPDRGVQVRQIPRLTKDGIPVSASAVRKHLSSGEADKIEDLVPKTTLDYLCEKHLSE